MSILNKIAAKIVDSQENPDKVPYDEMNFRQRASNYAGRMIGQGIGKALPDSVIHMLGDAIRAEKAAREEARAEAQKKDQERKKKEERDKQLRNTVAGTNDRLDELININKKMLKVIEGSGVGGFGGRLGKGGGLPAVSLSPASIIAIGAAITGAIKYGSSQGVDKAAEHFEKQGNQGDADVVRTSGGFLSTVGTWAAGGGTLFGGPGAVMGGVAGGIKGLYDMTGTLGDIYRRNTARNRANNEQTDLQQKFLDEKIANLPKDKREKLRQLQRQRSGMPFYNSLGEMRDEIEDHLNERSDRKSEWAPDRVTPTTPVAGAAVSDYSQRKLGIADLSPAAAAVPLAPGVVNSGTPNLNNLPIPTTGAMSLGANKSMLIQAIEQQTALRQHNAGEQTRDVRLDGNNIYIGSKTGSQLIKFEAPTITYEADKIEFKLRNGEAVPGSSAMPNSSGQRSGMPGAPGNDTPPAMMEALRRMGYSPGGGQQGPGGQGGQGGQGESPGSGGDPNGSGQPSGPADPNGHPVLQQQRQKFFDEMEKDPQLKSAVMGLIMKENGRHPEGPIEAMMNRAQMNGKSLRDTVYSGFYGPINRGEVHGAPRGKDLEKAQRAFDRVRGGSNDVDLRTDQGMINEHHGQKGLMEKHGEYYSYMGKKGERYAAGTQKQMEEYDRAHPGWRQQQNGNGQQQQQQPGSGSNSNFSWGKVDKSKINPDLAAAAEAGAGYLPKGYSVRASSGYREGDPRLHGRHMAADFEIVGPNGEVIPNSGKDNTGMYKQYAQHVYGWMQQNNPDAAGRLAWGGSFPIPYGRRYGQADLMHFDMGGQRGRWTQYQPQNMGGVRGVDYSQPPPTAYAQAPRPEQGSNERVKAAAMLSKQQSAPATPPPSAPKNSDPMSEELGKIGYVGTRPSGEIDNSPSSDPGRVGIARDYFERLFGNSPSGWS